METELTSLCQSVLEDFNLVLFYLPPPTHGVTHHCPSEEEEEQQQQQHADSSCPVLPDTLVFKMVVTCLMVVHSLKRGGWCDGNTAAILGVIYLLLLKSCSFILASSSEEGLWM